MHCRSYTNVKISKNAGKTLFKRRVYSPRPGGGQGRSNRDLPGVSSNRDSLFWL